MYREKEKKGESHIFIMIKNYFLIEYILIEYISNRKFPNKKYFFLNKILIKLEHTKYINVIKLNIT